MRIEKTRELNYMNCRFSWELGKIRAARLYSSYVLGIEKT